MRRTLRSPTRPNNTTGPSYPPGSMTNPHLSPPLPHSPFPHPSTGAYTSTDLSPEARSGHNPSALEGSDVRFTSATAAVAAARVMNASAGREAEGTIARRPVPGNQGAQGRHLGNASSAAASTFASRARARSQSRSQERGRGRGVLAGTAVAPAPLPLGTASASAPGSRAGSVTGGQGRRRGGRPAGEEGRDRVYPISGEGVILSNVTPPRTPRVGEGLDLPARSAEYDSAPPTPRVYEAEPVPNYVYGAEYDAEEVVGRLARDAQRSEDLAEARRSFVPMDEPGSWSANRTEPLPRVTPRASRPVMRKVEKTEEEKEEGLQQQGLKREGSLGRFGKKVLGVVKKAPRSRAGSVAGSRPGSPHSQRKEEKMGLQRSGSLVDKALDFFAPDRHEVAAAGKGQGFKGRMRIKAGLPASAGPTTPKPEAVEKKDSLDSGTSEPQDDEIWGFSRRMSSRLEAMEKEAEAARKRDEEYQARQTELNRQRAMAMLSGEDATEVRPSTSDSRVTTFSQFINARDSMESVKPPAPLKIVKENEREPREIWNEIKRAQAPEQTSAPLTKDKGKDKDASGMFGMSYIPFAEFQKVAAKMHMPWEEKKQPRGFSCGSDMSFADCGAPDMMEECSRCGLVPTGAHFLRNGLCAKCTHPAFRTDEQKAALEAENARPNTMWPRQSTFNRNTTYSDYSRNPFTDTRPRLPLTASSLGILPEAEAAESVNWTTFPPGGSNPTAVRENHNRTEEYVPVRSNWRRASTSEDVRLQSTRDTAFYNFYEDLLPNGTRDSVAQNMRRRPSYF